MLQATQRKLDAEYSITFNIIENLADNQKDVLKYL